MSDCITFLLNDKAITADGVDPATTLLDWLRSNPQLRGTKEGCAEGDCGACTVILECRTAAGSIERRAVTSCILMLGQIDGLGVRTIEGIGAPGTPGHFLQKAMAEGGGTQCGFCTPGFIMAGEALLRANRAPTPHEIHDAIAGNLCRCTGYRPIVAALQSGAAQYRRHVEESGAAPDDLGQRLGVVAATTAGERSFATPGRGFHAPKSLSQLFALRVRHPDAILVAGATDLGLLAGRDRNPPAELIAVSGVAELNELGSNSKGLTIGAATTYRDALPVLIAVWPELSDYLARFGSAQIRGSGTIGGNLATASPIGDMAPVLMALRAQVRLVSAGGERTLPVEDFVVGYRRTALTTGEVIRAIVIPPRRPGELFVAEKLSRRRDQDISTLTAALRVMMVEGLVQDCSIAFGGMADRVMRAPAVEAALRGTRLLPETLAPATAALAASFAPIDDVRAPALYRRSAAANLLTRMALKLTRPDLKLELDRL
jgi:xanthine dehydrogenase small subunit